uniref:microtubule-associated tumor suppressor candidate 2 homolog isoform X3 n=1 Tax=Scatophagus argus TaxID=75038 RepID=UPI001ED85657|nr:microtubule-associated tumor suppressor candidate 2 homolog isoform X3 [Scatophagus argus]
MSVPQPSEGLPVRGESGSTMRLPLAGAGDHNGNAFPISSSSSSSSSCLGESSPESLRSLSSLSGGRTDSPLDYDMFEVTLMTNMDKMTAVAISKWEPVEETKPDDSDDISVGKMQTATELTESNDNSVSVYLDADSGDYHQDTWNDNLTLALSLTTNSGSHGKNNNDLSSASGNERRHGSSTPDSDATEIPADDDDEEEALFLSVSSDMDVQRGNMTLISSTTCSGRSAVMTELQTDGSVALSVAEERSELVSEGLAEFSCPRGLHVESQAEPSASEDLRESTEMSLSSSSPSSANPSQNAKEITSTPLAEAERCTVGPRSHTSQPVRATKTKSNTAASAVPKTGASTATKQSSLEPKRLSKLDPKNVKAKVGSWSTPSPTKTPSQQDKSAPAKGKRVVPKREERQTGDWDKKQRSAGPVKVAVVVKPIRGKSSNLKINHKAAASESTQPEKKSVAISRTLSTSSSSLGSEDEDRPLDSPRKAPQEVPDKHETTENEEALKESVEDQREGSGMAVITETTVEKPKSTSRKVSSKLGPNVRQQGRGIRVDKGPLGPAQPPGSGTGLPGQGSPGPRKAQSDCSALSEDGQSAGCGSPTKARQSQTQCQGIPKPRTTTERPFTLAALGAATSNSKSTSSQQTPSGSVGRPATPAASKLPVKGLSTSLSSSSLGSIENNGATGEASASSSGAPAGTKPDEQASRSTHPLGSQSSAKPPMSSSAATTSTSALSQAVTSDNNGVITAPKPTAIRSRALSLQARTTATGLKTPTVTNHNTAKTANQHTAKMAPTASHLAKQASQYPLQRSGSARLSRQHNTVWAQQLCMPAWQPPVDKNKPREAPARPTNFNSSTQGAAPAGGNNQQQPPPDLLPDLVNANAPGTPVFPLPATDTTNTGQSTIGVSGVGSKARTGSRSSPKTGSRPQNSSKPGAVGSVVANGTLTVKQNQSKEQAEKKNQAINQLRKLLVQGNRRVEALATVIQHLFTEREEALNQKKELSQELTKIRHELVKSSQCCKDLQKEKEEVRVGLEEALKRLEEQHKEELVQLEDRLRSFYQTEWDKVHQMYQDEADKYRMLMEQQVEELRSRQEAERKNQEVSHSQKMESLKLQYETSIQELKRIQQTDLERLEKTLKETETSLSEKVSELSAEKDALNEKLKAEEERRKHILSDKNLKDSHTVYLEQELDSLKVVLEIKNNQLHQKEKKLMEMDRLVETNVKLEECLKKVQQENEDYKARMDKHAALSKQLSNEQAILQQTLQKESKVNKRLSMENEELLWKLHNGDLLASPRRLSPTSPFNSPRNSASFPTTAPLSPR